ncbi:MAG: TetR/AcrR family transcriptional regulator [Spirochaetaceae bacterium]|jgi:AcrR family transcriptional regulator|nr:TetR/AcrR family transcriptional regulator [Spirochaetaceae bacterium]
MAGAAKTARKPAAGPRAKQSAPAAVKKAAPPAAKKAPKKACSRTLTSRQLKARASRDRIFDTAIQLIRKNGYDQTGVIDICRKAGVSTGAFYHYFESKQAILNELYVRADRFFESYIASRKGKKDCVAEAKAYMAIYIHFVTLEGLSNGLDMCRNLYTPKNQLFAKEGRSMQTLLERIIRKGQLSREISRRFSPREWVNFLFSVLRGIIFDWVLRAGSYDIEEYAKFHIECLGNYLKA